MEFRYFKMVTTRSENKEYLFPTLRICRIVSGEFDWQIGNEIYAVKSGDIVLLNNLVSRKIFNQYAQKINIDVFEFSPAYIQARSLLLSMFYSGNPVELSVEKQKMVNALLTVIADAYGKTSKHIAFNYIMQAVFEILEDTPCDIKRNHNGIALAIKAIDFIWKHYSEDISVPVVAKHLNVSKSQLEKQFKNVHSISVGAYIRMIRVYNVTSRLNEKPEESVLEAALSCGFNSSSGFYKAYKAVTGRNPRRKTNGF